MEKRSCVNCKKCAECLVYERLSLEADNGVFKSFVEVLAIVAKNCILYNEV